MHLCEDLRIRHATRFAAAWANVVVKGRYGPRSIIGANAGESGHAGENHRPPRLRPGEVLAPDPRGTAVTGFEDDRGAASPAALQVEAPTDSDVDEAGEVTLRSGCNHRGRRMSAEWGDGTKEGSNCHGSERMTKLGETHD
jgi:hypothetical protein